MDIVNQIENIISQYHALRTKDDESRKSNNPDIVPKLKGLEASIQALCAYENIEINVSLGSGRLPEKPIVYFRDKKLSKSGNEGMYIALSILPKTAEQKGRFTLSLAQGMTKLKNELGSKEAANKVLLRQAKEIARKYQEDIRAAGFTSCLDEALDAPHRVFETHFEIGASLSSEELASMLHMALGIYTDIAITEQIKSDANLSPDIIEATKHQPNRVTRDILERRGQGQFRKQLLEKYNGTCVVTGCRVEAALEAAHIIPVKEGMDMSPDNGLLLRSDAHTLYDLNLFIIKPDGQIVWDTSLHGSEYAEYRSVDSRLLSEQVQKNLEERIKLFTDVV
ncbi:MrcB family domain-containing protein [Alteromonas gracilis]|uniref:MrcB family domain-containing protein n=1 Tax=Alteromonas gracilis TaxID=1479524 RepID=UPI00321AF529